MKKSLPSMIQRERNTREVPTKVTQCKRRSEQFNCSSTRKCLSLKSAEALAFLVKISRDGRLRASSGREEEVVGGPIHSSRKKCTNG